MRRGPGRGLVAMPMRLVPATNALRSATVDLGCDPAGERKPRRDRGLRGSPVKRGLPTRERYLMGFASDRAATA